MEIAAIAKVIWEGDSQEVLRSFPAPIRHDFGYALYQLQLGQVPIHTRPMQSIGQGVFEIKEQDGRAWYRVIYLKKIGNRVYVLHCFEKRSAKTSRRDIETARVRLTDVRKRLREEDYV